MARIFLILTLLISLLWACTPDEEPPPVDPDRLKVSLMFHFNQDLVPYALAADEISYERLVATLLEYPGFPVQIHISGTLLQMMKWSESPTPELLRKGVERGQFELHHSTYSQNIIYATTDSLLNDAQLRMHRELMDSHFGVSAPGFWNAERVWSSGVAETIASQGEYYVPVESHILFESGLDSLDRRTWRYETPSGPLTVIHDDAEFRSFVNHVFNTGETEPLDNYLRLMHEADRDGDFLISFHEDAEAAGLWQYEGGHLHPDEAMEHVRILLEYLSETEWIQPVVPSHFLASAEPDPFPGEILTGEALWMIHFSQEIGYDNWFDYLDSDSLKANILSVFDELKPEVRRISENISALDADHPAAVLFEHAMRFYAAYSYELGASWYWTGNDAGFHRVRDMRFLLYASEAAINDNADGITIKDVNQDGTEEIVWLIDNELIILQKNEARILQWINLETGELLLDNSWAYYYDEGWEPGNITPPLLKAGEDVYPWLAGNELIPSVLEKEFRLRSTGPYLKGDADTVLNYQLQSPDPDADQLRWTAARDDDQITLILDRQNGLSFTWELPQNHSSEFSLSHTFANEPWHMLKHGQSVLETGNGYVRNSVTETQINYEITPETQSVSQETVLFGKRKIFQIDGETKELKFRLWVELIEP